MGTWRNTVRAPLVSEAPPKYVRKPAGSIVDAVEPQIHELLRLDPKMPATVIAERIGWTRGITVLKERGAVLRPAHLAGPGEPDEVRGRGRRAVRFVVPACRVRAVPSASPVAAVDDNCRRTTRRVGQLIPRGRHRICSPDGVSVVDRLGAVPRTLVWDSEGAVGRWLSGQERADR